MMGGHLSFCTLYCSLFSSLSLPLCLSAHQHRKPLRLSWIILNFSQVSFPGKMGVILLLVVCLRRHSLARLHVVIVVKGSGSPKDDGIGPNKYSKKCFLQIAVCVCIFTYILPLVLPRH